VARSLRDEGRALLFISHRFDEVFSLCDAVTVMRDGAYIATQPIADTDVDTIVRQMVGRDVADLFPKQEAVIGDVVLDVQGLTSAGVFDDISFQVRSGEIVGLAGLVGAGRSEVARAVFGVDSYDRGTVTLRGRRVPGHDPAGAMRAGLALVPEDRRKEGLVIGASVAENLTIAIRQRLAAAGLFITGRRENEASRVWASRLEVKSSALDTEVGTFSGGNQQKVVLAKWLATEPAVLIVDEPTRGIDVGTKAEVHRLLSQLAGEGLAILMISSELPEVLGMADRVLVVREGRIVGAMDRSEATQERIGHLVLGSHPESDATTQQEMQA
jgi:rhamnose transport system ATP-binding protein